MENANSVTDTVRGVGKCPYSPLSNITAMITLNGQYFAGSPMDFSGADSAIVRDLGASYLRTKNYDAKWLNEPQFVGSFETDAYVYFLFRESAVEYINCGKVCIIWEIKRFQPETVWKCIVIWEVHIIMCTSMYSKTILILR